MTWLFFDLGSTLIDETVCYQQRILDTIVDTDISLETFQSVMFHYAKMNKDAYSCACCHFGLEKVLWRNDLEILYAGVVTLLNTLKQRYALGIIANQEKGLTNRLKQFSIDSCFSIIVGSGDFNLIKPDVKIFKKALALADCSPNDAVMIGDRLDNDILPAQLVGMKTVWVKQGFGGYGNPFLLPFLPNAMIPGITKLLTLIF